MPESLTAYDRTVANRLNAIYSEIASIKNNASATTDKKHQD